MPNKEGITVVNFVLLTIIAILIVLIVSSKLQARGAKLRAIEVEPEVGKWNKLQVSYTLSYETLGSFLDIAYIPPGVLIDKGENSRTTTFSYSSDLENGKGRFLAINNVKLENCKKREGHWLAYGNPEQIIGNAVIELPIPRCTALTPNFHITDIR